MGFKNSPAIFQRIMEKELRNTADKNNIKSKDLFMQVRLAVTGKTVGPPLLESFEILGREEVMRRINYSIKSIQ